MRLHELSWMEVEAYLKRSTGIVIPIGSTEQHGPNGLLGTDAICPEVIAQHAGKEAGFLVGPTFNVGMAQHHLAFPGTISLRPSTMIAALMDWIASLRRHGFDHIYFYNGHGGNIATITAAFSEAYAEDSFAAEERAPLRLKLKCWWESREVEALCKELYPAGHGSHATPSEVAVTYYAYPHAQKQVDMSPKIAPNGEIRDARDYRRTFPDGRIGSDPSVATPEQGERLVKTAAAALMADYERFLKS